MTPLEGKIRQALREEAGDIQAGTTPPLRLPARRRRFFSLTYGGGERKEAPAAAWRGWLSPVAAAVVVGAVIAAGLAVSRALPARGRPAGDRLASAAAINEAAAAWTGAQVSRSARVSCDRQMCQLLAAQHIPPADLNVLTPGAATPLRSDVIVATAEVRRELGARLGSVYAPVILASFGSGKTRVDIRLIAPQGAATYRSELSADLQARKAAGRQLSDSKLIRMSAVARRQLLAGQVDSRLLTLLTTLAMSHPVTVVAFRDSGPGAAPGVPLRAVELAAASQTINKHRALSVDGMLALVNQQQPPFRPARAGEIRLRDDETVIRIQFPAPSPLGLFGAFAAPGPLGVNGTGGHASP
jgi:hypothetical protein